MRDTNDPASQGETTELGRGMAPLTGWPAAFARVGGDR